MEAELAIYEVTHRETGEKSYQAASSAAEACDKAGWVIGDCYVQSQRPRYRTTLKGEPVLMVKVPCRTCPFQYAECTLPKDETCPVRPEAPELKEWLKQASKAHLCGHVGQELSKNDHSLCLKMIPIAQAIEQLTAQT